MSKEPEPDINSCYHGKLSRQEAEQILLEGDRPDGSFLLRESNTSEGDYVLSVLQAGAVCHDQIRRCAYETSFFFTYHDNNIIHGLEGVLERYMAPGGAIRATAPVAGARLPPDSCRNGSTNLLHRATSEGSYTVVSELLRSGYRHESKNMKGQTAVHLASIRGSNDILKKLLEHGANVNSRDTAGLTPLHYACQNNFRSTVRLLVQEGNANVQARATVTGAVPLHEAAARGHTEVVQELLRLNAPALPRDAADRLPEALARLGAHDACADVLRQYRTPAARTERARWYHGTLDRLEAERVIRAFDARSGTFLVRWSDRNKRNVLSLMNESVLFHFIILSRGQHLFIDNGPYLESLEHVVEYYSLNADGLPTVLITPVPPKPKPPVPAFSTIPRQKKQSVTSQLDSPASHFKNISFSAFSFPNNNNNYLQDKPNDRFIPVTSIHKGDVIGVGEFGSVYKGTYTKRNGEVIAVAIKMMIGEQIENRTAFLSEAQVMLKLNHHCIVKLIGLTDDTREELFIVQELVPLGSMLCYVCNNRETINLRNDFTIWAAQIACGMNYLETQRFIHRDLAARNILLASTNQAKISDFGLTRALVPDHEYYRALQGGKWPLKWYAPESYNYGTFSHKSDIWSYGITIWEMYSFGEVPYGEMRGADAIKMIENGERLAQPEDCPDHIYSIMQRCWEYKAPNRPTFQELLDIFVSDTTYMNIKELLRETDLP